MIKWWQGFIVICIGAALGVAMAKIGFHTGAYTMTDEDIKGWKLLFLWVLMGAGSWSIVIGLFFGIRWLIEHL